MWRVFEVQQVLMHDCKLTIRAFYAHGRFSTRPFCLWQGRCSPNRGRREGSLRCSHRAHWPQAERPSPSLKVQGVREAKKVFFLSRPAVRPPEGLRADPLVTGSCLAGSFTVSGQFRWELLANLVVRVGLAAGRGRASKSNSSITSDLSSRRLMDHWLDSNRCNSPFSSSAVLRKPGGGLCGSSGPVHNSLRQVLRVCPSLSLSLPP